MSMLRVRLTFTCAALFSLGQAAAVDIAGPAGSVHFGSAVYVLPNGNIVVIDPDADSGVYSGVGAVYLYGPGGNLISTLKGSQPDDHVGSGFVVVLANGNYVIASPNWRNDTVANAGAVTWASATTGVSGVVSPVNSLVGSTLGDYVGAVTALANGNYVVSASNWDNGAVTDAGAVTWCDGNGGTVGAVSASNSLVGTSAGDQVAYYNVIALSNGNYVVDSSSWSNGGLAAVGAVTWGNGNGGTVGAVSASNSLIGSSADDGVGSGGVFALANGNYVVNSPAWSNGSTLYVGAVTWANGSGGTVGAVSAGNSLVGDLENDSVGYGGGVATLNNGNYVVASAFWHGKVGAATWGNGNGGTVGPVSASNSLVGSVPEDRIGSDGIAALSNGHYVAVSSNFNGKLGAVTWGNGGGGSTGAVSNANSLVGSSANDRVGYGGVTALRNGNYVVNSYTWNAGAGASTWGYGNGGAVGTVSSLNSLVGTAAGNLVGLNAVALSNGNYAVINQNWDDASNTDVGAVTWGDGNGGTVGAVSAGNSLVGSSAGDAVGEVTALANGNYVVTSSYWDNGAIADVGAVTLADGRGGTVGPVSAGASLVGGSAGDSVGGNTYALSNGSYVVISASWDNGAITDAGAITLRRGSDRHAATITSENSVVGLVASGGDSIVYAYDAARDQLVVGRPAENIVTLFKADLLLRDGFE